MTFASNESPRRLARGFTLVELLVVVAIIALLAGIVLGGLSIVRAKAGGARTLATMQAFQNAAEQFRQDHDYYPGLVPERLLANDPQITGTQNAVIHMLGGYVVEGEVTAQEYTDFGTAGGSILEFSFSDPDGGQDFTFKVDIARLGEGPSINGKAYEPYLTLRDDDLGPASRDGTQVNDLALPDVLDAWGTPIVYLRRASDVGELIEDPDVNAPVQYLPQTMRPYIQASALGRLGKNQVWDGSDNVEGSILTGIAQPMIDEMQVPVMNMRRIIESPGVEGRARGAFMLLSAGPDGVYYSAVDGPGNAAEIIVDLGNRPRSVIEEYDDVVLFGGS